MCTAPPRTYLSLVGTIDMRRVARGRTLEMVKVTGILAVSLSQVADRQVPIAFAWRSRMVSTDGPVGDVGRGANVHTMLPRALNAAASSVTRLAVGRDIMKLRTVAVRLAPDFLWRALIGCVGVNTRVGSLAYTSVLPANFINKISAMAVLSKTLVINKLQPCT